MRADELPADMEGRLTEALNDVERIGMTHEDVRIAAPLFDAVNRSRALLKAYQEQRRALEAASPVVPVGSADTLERQAAEIERLREALEKIDNADTDFHEIGRDQYGYADMEECMNAEEIRKIARAALTGEDT